MLASVEELTSRPDLFDCGSGARCARVQRFSTLWPENRTAWDCYQALRHRTVLDIQAGAWVITNFTAGWSWRRIADLLRRLDLILEVLAPGAPPESHGRRTAP